MSVVGIIAEYNPFHNGHLLQLREIRRRLLPSGVIVLMSGSLTQRGSVAILDKWQRAEAAVRGGASLVLELPCAFATRSAQHFAFGGVCLLERLGVVDTLAFGAEQDNLDLLRKLAQAGDTTETAGRLRAELARGASYAAALASATECRLSPKKEPGAISDEYIPPADANDDTALSECLRQPNVILAVEYLRAIEKTRAALTPFVLPRFGADHHDTELPSEPFAAVASASAIRLSLAAQGKRQELPRNIERTVPTFVCPMLAEALARGIPDDERLFRPLLSLLYTSSDDELRHISGIREGLEHRFRNAALSAASLSSFVESVSSRRYPRTGIRRTILHLLLGLRKDDVLRMDTSGPLYARVLAFDNNGRRLLRLIQKTSHVSVVTKAADFLPARSLVAPDRLSPAQAMLALDLRATALASLASSGLDAPRPNDDYLRSPVYLRET